MQKLVDRRGEGRAAQAGRWAKIPTAGLTEAFRRKGERLSQPPARLLWTGGPLVLACRLWLRGFLEKQCQLLVATRVLAAVLVTTFGLMQDLKTG